jgi:hypothetical protein
VVAQIRSWRHSGFNVDRSVRLEGGNRDGIERLPQYLGRSPFSLTRLVRITPTGQVVYRPEKERPQRYPDPAAEGLLPGALRNFEVFEPLDFLAELVQHIPDKGEHLVRYYGCYSNKARGKWGLAPKRGAVSRERACTHFPGGTQSHPCVDPDLPPLPDARSRRRWAILIKHVYHVAPLLCPRCGGTMKVIGFIEARQGDVIRKILQHCGLWQDPPARSPPSGPCPLQPGAQTSDSDSRRTYEVDPDFLEHARREQIAPPNCPGNHEPASKSLTSRHLTAPGSVV